VAKLAINVDHVATVRQARRAPEPDPVTAAALAELAGAEGIVVHLREDRRHIQDRDVEVLRRTVQTRLNLEMAATDEMIEFALKIRPDVVTLVPEKRRELTTEGGLDVVASERDLTDAVRRLHSGSIRVSLFVNADPPQVEAAKRTGADCVEIHTGTFAEAENEARRGEELTRIEVAVQIAHELGLVIHAGHGLDYRNVGRLRHLSEIEELSIGHAVVARAVLVGMERAVREMLERIRD
jgi:pyridoxine 5-phosphate synthase